MFLFCSPTSVWVIHQQAEFKGWGRSCLHIHQRGSQPAEGWSRPVWWTCLWQNHSSEKKSRGDHRKKKEKGQMRNNPPLDSSGALMLTCACSRILIATTASPLSSVHVFHSQWITQSNFSFFSSIPNTPTSYTVEWLAVSLIAFSGATPMSCGRRPAEKYYS